MSIDSVRKKNIENNVVKRVLWLFLISSRLEGLKKKFSQDNKKITWHQENIPLAQNICLFCRYSKKPPSNIL